LPLGLLAGFCVSKMLNLKGDDPTMGIVGAAVGSFVGGWMYSLFTGTPVTGFNMHTLGIAAIGAAFVLLIWHLMRRHSFSKY
jgi:uncharacterized membrane protein YeaQ/YmgE (transglycosylase-associated protein family)